MKNQAWIHECSVFGPDAESLSHLTTSLTSTSPVPSITAIPLPANTHVKCEEGRMVCELVVIYKHTYINI